MVSLQLGQKVDFKLKFPCPFGQGKVEERNCLYNENRRLLHKSINR